MNRAARPGSLNPISSSGAIPIVLATLAAAWKFPGVHPMLPAIIWFGVTFPPWYLRLSSEYMADMPDSGLSNTACGSPWSVLTDGPTIPGTFCPTNLILPGLLLRIPAGRLLRLVSSERYAPSSDPSLANNGADTPALGDVAATSPAADVMGTVVPEEGTEEPPPSRLSISPLLTLAISASALSALR